MTIGSMLVECDIDEIGTIIIIHYMIIGEWIGASLII